MQWCSGIITHFSTTLKGSQVANQHLINTKSNGISLFPFISTAIFSLSEMETVDLSKPSLCTVCVLLLAPQQVRLKPRRNKTNWVCAFPPHIFPRTGLQGKDHCAPPRALFWAVSIPAPKFYCFLKAFDLPDMISLNFAVRSGEKFDLTHANVFHWQLKKILRD